MYASHYIIGLSPDDVVYCHLPLYHSSGGQVATCSSILFGTKTVIRKKFSASAFWKDCVNFNITVSTTLTTYHLTFFFSSHKIFLKMTFLRLIAFEYMFDRYILNFPLPLTNQMPEFGWSCIIWPKQPIQSLYFGKQFKIYLSNVYSKAKY